MFLRSLCLQPMEERSRSDRLPAEGWLGTSENTSKPRRCLCCCLCWPSLHTRHLLGIRRLVVLLDLCFSVNPELPLDGIVDLLSSEDFWIIQRATAKTFFIMVIARFKLLRFTSMNQTELGFKKVLKDSIRSYNTTFDVSAPPKPNYPASAVRETSLGISTTMLENCRSNKTPSVR
jgi:hypothetical protein